MSESERRALNPLAMRRDRDRLRPSSLRGAHLAPPCTILNFALALCRPQFPSAAAAPGGSP
eukprot:scaffold37057_cov43-Phaeocystis_antarctica.AAC.1